MIFCPPNLPATPENLLKVAKNEGRRLLCPHKQNNVKGHHDKFSLFHHYKGHKPLVMAHFLCNFRPRYY